MYRSDLDSRTLLTDVQRLTTLAHRMRQWSQGQAGAVHVLDGGNYQVSYGRLRLQTMQGCFTQLAAYLAGGRCLVSDTLDELHWALVQDNLSTLDSAVDLLYQQSLVSCDAEYTTVKAEIASARLFTHSLQQLQLMRGPSEQLQKRLLTLAQAGCSYAQMAPCYRELARLLTAMRGQCLPSFEGKPKRTATWLKIRSAWTDPVIHSTRAWAKYLAGLWLSRQYREVLVPAGFPEAGRYACTDLPRMVQYLTEPYEKELDAGYLPAGSRAAILRDLGQACAQLCEREGYSVEDLGRLQELGQRISLMMEAHAVLARLLLNFRPPEKAHQAAFYASILSYVHSELDPQSKLGHLLLQLAKAWDPQDEASENPRLRKAILNRVFASRLYLERREARTMRRCYDYLSDYPAARSALQQFCGSLIDGSVNDPLVTVKLEALQRALEAFERDCERIQACVPGGVLSSWPVASLITMVQAQSQDYEQTRLQLDKAALQVLPTVLGNFRREDSDFTLICGERSYPVHRVVLTRLVRHGDSLLSGLLRYPKDCFSLPSQELFAGESVPQFHEVLVGCLLNYLYCGQIPDTVATQYAAQLDRAFAYLWPELEGKSWRELRPPSPSDWFDPALLEQLSDCRISCADGEYPFYRAVLKSLPGALGQASDLDVYRLRCHDIELLLRLGLGDLAGFEPTQSSWESFLRLDPLANWLLGEELWQQMRSAAGERCIGTLSDAAFIEALVLAQSEPRRRLVPIVSGELVARLKHRSLGLADEQLSCVRRLKVSDAQLCDAAWQRFVNFACGCSQLHQLDLSRSNIPAHHVLSLVKAHPKLSLCVEDCPSLNPAVRDLLAGRHPNLPLPRSLDALTVHALLRLPDEPALISQALSELQNGPQAQLSIEAVEALAAGREASIQRLDLTDNAAVNSAFIRNLVKVCPELIALNLSTLDAARYGTVLLQELPKLHNLAALTVNQQLHAALKPVLPRTQLHG